MWRFSRDLSWARICYFFSQFLLSSSFSILYQKMRNKQQQWTCHLTGRDGKEKWNAEGWQFQFRAPAGTILPEGVISQLCYHITGHSQHQQTQDFYTIPLTQTKKVTKELLVKFESIKFYSQIMMIWKTRNKFRTFSQLI